MERPLILVTNDDGIESDGLWAAVRAALPLGEVLVVAPDRQWSGGGRSMPRGVTGRLARADRVVDGERVKAYAVDASPALTVDHGVVELAPRRPALVISGANFGANLSIEVTISGTVGAALEGSAFGIPALAVSLEMDASYHLTGDNEANYVATVAATRQFAQVLLQRTLPPDVDVLSVNIPSDATPETPWRLTKLSRLRYFLPQRPDRANGQGRPGYKLIEDVHRTAPDSDIRAVMVDRVISVTPLSLNLTSRTDLSLLYHSLNAEASAGAPEFSTIYSCPARDRVVLPSL